MIVKECSTSLGTPSEIVKEAEQIINKNPVSLQESNLETRLSEPIQSDLFKPTGKILGMGSWGSVAEYKGPTNQYWAVKRFAPDEAAKRKMVERNLTADEIMLNESVPLSAAAHHVAPRIIARDQNGEMFVAMPFYSGGTFKNKFYTFWNGEKQKLDDSQLGKDMLKIANALAYIHDQPESPGEWKKRAHADLKPDNILLDEKGEVFVSDLGSSTAISMSERSVDSRSKLGARDYRAPECYQDGSHPDSRSDVFSWGAIALEKLTGEKVYSSINPEDASKEALIKEISIKIKKTPRKWRPILEKTLAVESSDRFYDGKELHNALEKRLKRYEEGSNLFGAIKNSLKWSIPSTFIAAAIYGASTYEPTKLEMPSIQPRVQGMLYPPSNAHEGVEFDAELISDLPKAVSGGWIDSQQRVAKLSTQNRVVAYLAKCYGQTLQNGGISSHTPLTKDTYELFVANTTDSERQYLTQGAGGPVLPVAAKALEVAMVLSKTKDAKIDLEDTFAIARVGPAKVMEAKRISGSENYRSYRNAVDSKKGELIIPEIEKKFIDTCLSYYHSDI